MFILHVTIHSQLQIELLTRTYQDHEADQACEAFEFYARQPYHNVSLDAVTTNGACTRWLEATSPITTQPAAQ